MTKRIVDSFFSENSWWTRWMLILCAFVFIWVLGTLIQSTVIQRVGYVLVFSMVFMDVLINAALYLEDLYEIHGFSKVMEHLLCSMFHIGQPSLKIVHGEKDVQESEVNALDRIGGPGLLTVEPGNVVILETLLAPARILGAGEHYVKRGEIIKDIIVLEEYSGEIDKITVSTRDGIDVKVVDVEFRFCINQSSQKTSSRTMQHPYPFSRKSVYDIVYSRNVEKDGKAASWTNAVQGVVKRIISEHISSHNLDALLSPATHNAHPMFELRSKFELPQNQEKFKSAGAKLLWINIGNVVPESALIEEQRLDVWLAKQEGVEKMLLAQGEAEKISSRERGRAEAQAVLLRSIAQALQEIDAGDKQDNAKTAKNLWNIVMARTAQILESMNAVHEPEDRKDHKDYKDHQDGQNEYGYSKK